MHALERSLLLRRLAWAALGLIVFVCISSLVSGISVRFLRHKDRSAQSAKGAERSEGGENPGGAASFAAASSSRQLSLSIIPSHVEQGDPVMIVISGTTTAGGISQASVSGPAGTSPLYFGAYGDKLVAFFGARLRQDPGTYRVTVAFKSSAQKLSTDLAVSLRPEHVEALAVPESLGGNSTQSQLALVSTLGLDNAQLHGLPANLPRPFWTLPFSFPVASPTVTDPYGYIRDSGAATIAHLGTDFEAPPGTPVYAINRGIVRAAQEFTAYGNTVVLDHGLGVESLYMHLSSIVAVPGETVDRGDLLGYSGETGYAEGPHLHLSIWLDGVSVDPMKFLALFGTGQ